MNNEIINQLKLNSNKFIDELKIYTWYQVWVIW
jgi:hypothetical protein